jgi:uncharacterized protein (DUF1330 family)
MNYYLIVEITITDDSWVPEYVQEVTRMIGQYGGRYLARTPHTQRLEGERALPQVVALIEFPSQEALQAWYSSAEYKPYLQQRLRGATTELTVVPGEDAFAQG